MKDKIIDILSRFWFVLLILFCCIVLSIKFASGQNLEIDDARHLIEGDQTNKGIAVLNQEFQVYEKKSQQDVDQAWWMTKSKNTGVLSAVSVAYRINSRLAGKALLDMLTEAKWLVITVHKFKAMKR